jgi:hypothetical protein
MFGRTGAAGGDAAAPTGGAGLLGGARGAPKAGAAMVGTNAGVGGRSVAAGNDGAPKAVLTAGVRRGCANGGTRPAGELTGVGVLVVGAPAGTEDTAASASAGGGESLSAARAAGAGVVRVAGGDTSVSGKSSPQLTLAETGITPPQTEQRALTAAPTTLAGSTRKTDRHSGHDTFIHSSTMLMALGARGGVGSLPLAMKSVRRSTE